MLFSRNLDHRRRLRGAVGPRWTRVNDPRMRAIDPSARQVAPAWSIGSHDGVNRVVPGHPRPLTVFRVFSSAHRPDTDLTPPLPQQYNRRFVNVVVGLGKKRSPNSNAT